jgi:hypothetical protein
MHEQTIRNTQGRIKPDFSSKNFKQEDMSGSLGAIDGCNMQLQITHVQSLTRYDVYFVAKCCPETSCPDGPDLHN